MKALVPMVVAALALSWVATYRNPALYGAVTIAFLSGIAYGWMRARA